MAVNKVIYGNTTLIDLTDSNLSSADQLPNGVSAYNRNGVLLQGTAEYMELVDNPVVGDVLVTDANGQAIDGGTPPIFWGDDVGTFTTPINADQLQGYTISTLVSVLKADIVDALFPVDSVYMTYTNTNPSMTLGGTWELVSSVALASEHVFGNGKTLSVNDTTGNFGLGRAKGSSGSYGISAQTNFYGGSPGAEWSATFSTTGTPKAIGLITKTQAGNSPQNTGVIADTITLYTWKRTA